MTKRSRAKQREKSAYQKKTFHVPTLHAKSEAQGQYILCINGNILTFGVGSSGAGKTYVATALAGQMLYEGKIDKIVITRPAEECGKSLGFLPGTQEEKYAPYIQPVQAVLESIYGKGWFDSQVKNKNIEPIPLGFMMGKTLDNTFLIADEMQNATSKEMFILLSRIGENTKAVINGDYKMQRVVSGDSGLEDAVERLKEIEDVAVFEFTSQDCVRSGLCKKIVQAYEK